MDRTTSPGCTVLRADARRLPLPDESVDLIVTSPPYFSLRSYTDGGEHYAGQIGAEPTPAEYIASLIDCTREWMRVLKPSGSLFVNLGDKYQATSFAPQKRGKDASGVERPTVTNACERCGTSFTGGPGRRFCSSFCGGSDNSPRASRGGPPVKSLLMLPERYRIAAVDELGLIARAVLVWSKPNGLPESVKDRVRRSHEDWVHLTKQPRYFSAVDEIREPHSDTTTKLRSWDERKSAGVTWTPGLGTRGTHLGNESAPNSRMAGNPLGKLPGSVWEIATQPLKVPDHISHARCCNGDKRDGCTDGIDHFAAFPMEWPRRLILGWSPSGICTACGEGRRPVSVGERTNNGHPVDPAAFSPDGRFNTATGHRNNFQTLRTITGEACACPDTTAPTRPAVVLDPFGGTGTTALVASVLGRHGISGDMSADYCRLARWRTSDPRQRARAAQTPKQRRAPAPRPRRAPTTAGHDQATLL